MPKLTVTSAKAVPIPGSQSRRWLRWRNAQVADGGAQVQVSLRSDIDPSSTSKCGVPFEAGEGETINAHQFDLKRALYFRATGDDTVIFWDSEKTDPNA